MGFLQSLGTFLKTEYPYAPIDTLTIEIHPLFPTAQTNILRKIYYIFVKTYLMEMATAPLFVNQFSIFVKILKPKTHIYL